MGQSLGLVLVAEGVETEEQMQILTDMGVHRIQGYLIERPLAGADLDARLNARQNGEAMPDAPSAAVSQVIEAQNVEAKNKAQSEAEAS